MVEVKKAIAAVDAAKEEDKEAGFKEYDYALKNLHGAKHNLEQLDLKKERLQKEHDDKLAAAKAEVADLEGEDVPVGSPQSPAQVGPTEPPVEPPETGASDPSPDPAA